MKNLLLPLLALACLISSLYAADSGSIPPPPKISGEIVAHQKEKIPAPGLNAEEHARQILARGLNAENLESEDCAIYVKNKLTAKEIAELAAKGVIIHETYVPPVPGQHPMGFYLCTVQYSSLGTVAADPRFVRLESTEFLSEPQNDLGATMTMVDMVHAGQGVPARNGQGIKIAIADSGLDITHPDLPVPVEAFDVTDGSGVGSWGKNVANKVSAHGTHVAGTVLGRGTLSGGKYKGMAPAASLYFYKIGNDTTAGSSETDEIEAMQRAAAVGADIFTMSYGGMETYLDGSTPRCQALDATVAAGVTCFVSAGNERQNDDHFSANVPAATTSGALTVTLYYDYVPNKAKIDFRVNWRDGLAGDSNINVICTNLESGESLTEAFYGWSSRGTESKRFSLATNQPSWETKTYTFKIQNTAPTGTTPRVHLYETTGFSYFDKPDLNYIITAPAYADNAIAVGAWTQRKSWPNYEGDYYQYSSYTTGTLAPFSSLGPRIDGRRKPDIVAPGAATISLRDSVPGLADSEPLIIDNDGVYLNVSGPANYYIMSGTSMATPHAAGLAALLLQAKPWLTPVQVRDALRNSASKWNAPNNTVGWGLVNARTAITGRGAPVASWNEYD